MPSLSSSGAGAIVYVLPVSTSVFTLWYRVAYSNPS